MSPARDKNPEPLPKTLPGVVCAQRVRCGKPNCRCATGPRHLAFYRFWRQGGRLRKRYVPRPHRLIAPLSVAHCPTHPAGRVARLAILDPRRGEFRNLFHWRKPPFFRREHIHRLPVTRSDAGSRGNYSWSDEPR